MIPIKSRNTSSIIGGAGGGGSCNMVVTIIE